MNIITAARRKELAATHGVDEQYLYQCLSRRRQMDAAEAMRLETESGQELRRWQLRWADWHRIWPELVGTEGAPSVPAPTAPLNQAAQPAATAEAGHAAA